MSINNYEKQQKQQNGYVIVIQGKLSVLISVKIKIIPQYLKPDVDCTLYADDFQIGYR